MGSESNRGAQGRGRVQGKRMVFARRFTLAAVLVAVLASLAFDCGIGTPSSFGIGQFNLLCPLGGLEAMLASKAFIPVAAISAGVLLLFALVFGRAWCAWGCPAPVIRRFFKRDPKPAKPGTCASSCAACSGAKAALDVKASLAFLARESARGRLRPCSCALSWLACRCSALYAPSGLRSARWGPCGI